MEKTVLTQSGERIQEDLNVLENLIPFFSTFVTYNVGQLVRHNNYIYKCRVAVTTAGDWTGGTNWDLTNLDFIVNDGIKIYNISDITSLDNLSSDFVNKLKVGDYVVEHSTLGNHFAQVTAKPNTPYYENAICELVCVFSQGDNVRKVLYQYSNNQWAFSSDTFVAISPVEANPQDTAYSVLEKLKIGTSTYAIEKGNGFDYDVEVLDIDTSTNQYRITDDTTKPNALRTFPSPAIVRLIYYPNPNDRTYFRSIGFLQVTFDDMFHIIGFIDGGYVEQEEYNNFGSIYLLKKSFASPTTATSLYNHYIEIQTATGTADFTLVSNVASYNDITEISFSTIVSIKSNHGIEHTYVSLYNLTFYDYDNELVIAGFYRDSSNKCQIGSERISANDVINFTDTVTAL